ncbi:hypothetical protein N7461_006585 [Penicillium sp. DV-2018c]|nr:hypothetical protein N7461_006585 [Penicillium sp. DV-2018c]
MPQSVEKTKLASKGFVPPPNNKHGRFLPDREQHGTLRSATMHLLRNLFPALLGLDSPYSQQERTEPRLHVDAYH